MKPPDGSATAGSARADLRLLRRALEFVRPYRRQLGAVYLCYFLNSVLNLLPAASLAWYMDGVVRGGTFSFSSSPCSTASLNVGRSSSESTAASFPLTSAALSPATPESGRIPIDRAWHMSSA